MVFNQTSIAPIFYDRNIAAKENLIA